ncbi:MAG TPA: TetR/AcrR family transcriptional regulator [Mycobacterium sp.]|nr:TetR/AcrR family transcriptional regulator [Mycobacterium sp.]
MRTKWGDRAARRDDIVRAGRSLLRGDGLAALQMRDVARRAGVGLGTVYTYFPTKEALYAALYAERLDELLTDLAPQLSSTTDLEELFVLFATKYRDIYAEFGKDLDVLAAVGQQLTSSSLRVLGQTRTIIENAGIPDTELTLTLLWSTVTGLADHFTSARHQLLRNTWDETVRFAARTVVRGLVAEHQLHGG